MPFAVYISDKLVTLKQSQGHQTYDYNVDPKQDYNHAKLKDLVLMVSEKRPMLKFFAKRGNISIISLEHVQKNQKQ